MRGANDMAHSLPNKNPKTGLVRALLPDLPQTSLPADLAVSGDFLHLCHRAEQVLAEDLANVFLGIAGVEDSAAIIFLKNKRSAPIGPRNFAGGDSTRSE